VNTITIAANDVAMLRREPFPENTISIGTRRWLAAGVSLRRDTVFAPEGAFLAAVAATLEPCFARPSDL
jgi:hypothetical protein